MGEETTLLAEVETQASATEQVEVGPTALQAATSRAAAAEIAMPLEAAPGDMTDRTLALAAVAVRPAWDLVEVAALVVVVVGAAGRRPTLKANDRSIG